MNGFSNLSIRHKLILIIMVISTVSLLLASFSFITTDRIKTRDAVGSNLTTMAGIIAAHNTAALLFGDTIAAEETLHFLERHENIEAAGIFDINGDEFASYRKPGFTLALPDVQEQPENILFWDSHVEILIRIIHDDDVIGHVYMRSNLDEIERHLLCISVLWRSCSSYHCSLP